MANDRLYLCCTGCGECFFLSKYYPSCNATIGMNDLFWDEDRFKAFFNGHLDCNQNHENRCMDLGPDPLFVIHTETGVCKDPIAHFPKSRGTVEAEQRQRSDEAKHKALKTFGAAINEALSRGDADKS